MYDLIVIGAGPAGYEAALKAGEYNKKVLLIEKDKLGGTCLNYGCIPTKSLLYQSKKYKDLFSLSNYGITFENPIIDYKTILTNKNNTVKRLINGIEFLIKKNNISYIEGEATLLNEKTVKVNDSIYDAKNILIAVGSQSAPLNIEGYHHCLTSKEFLEKDLSDVKQVIIIGGGVIGVEIATILSNLKIKVIIIEAQDQLISNTDIDASTTLKKLLSREGVKIVLNSKINKIEQNKVYTHDNEFEGDFIISSVGRIPNTEKIDPLNILDKDKLFIKVNSEFKTNLNGVYAVGDCVKGWQLAHYATACALNIVNSLYSDKPILLNLNNVPMCIYTSDEIAIVGNKAESDDIVLKSDYVANAKAVLENRNKGFVKLIFSNQGLFKGATIMCPRASDMINYFVNALNNKLTIDDMNKDIYSHPTYSETIRSALFLYK
ncbi:MAG: FAD-binding protein [Spirochaetia bacterium]|nr:FAD-binding protein [Spirochaetia bacterium]